MTNAEKFEKVFGIKVDDTCPLDPCLMDNICHKANSCGDCPVYNFWEKEYADFIALRTEEEPKKGEWLRMSDLSEQEDDRYMCSRCGNVVHHKDKINLYTFNSWCGRCGSNNYPYPQESEENGKLMSKEEKNERKEV